MPINYNDLYKSYESRMTEAMADSAHDWHSIEFEQMCKDMMASALSTDDEQLEVDIQTTLNGRPCTMVGLMNDIKKQITYTLRKAFQK